MTAKQFWISASLGTVLCLAVAGAAVKAKISLAPAPVPPAPIPVPVPVPPPPPDVPAIALAGQKAKLQLTDGRTATFWFATSGSSLLCTAAIGLDQVLSYDLTPVADPSPPTPTPTPVPTPTPPVPSPRPPVPPTPPTPPVATSNLRVLFLYDPLTLIDMPPAKQALLAAPELRAYLDKHCPLESGCAGGTCPLQYSAGKTPSYRFLPSGADLSRLTPVWQQTCKAAAGKPVPWMIAVNEAGQTVIDQTWPANVNDTLKLLKKFGGE